MEKAAAAEVAVSGLMLPLGKGSKVCTLSFSKSATVSLQVYAAYFDVRAVQGAARATPGAAAMPHWQVFSQRPSACARASANACSGSLGRGLGFSATGGGSA